MKLKLPTDLERLNFEVNKLQSYEGIIELKKIRKPRTLKQNNYLYSLITLCAIEEGYSLNEMKQILKSDCDFMIYRKEGILFLRSSTDLDTKEMTNWIEWIRNRAGLAGYYLPSPEEFLRNWTEYERTVEQHKTYL